MSIHLDIKGRQEGGMRNMYDIFLQNCLAEYKQRPPKTNSGGLWQSYFLGKSIVC